MGIKMINEKFSVQLTNQRFGRVTPKKNSDELDNVYAPEINMFSCMDDGNCWNGQASIGERCYYPIGYGPDDDHSNRSTNISVNSIMIIITVISTFIL